jgi:hypothetical protein
VNRSNLFCIETNEINLRPTQVIEVVRFSDEKVKTDSPVNNGREEVKDYSEEHDNYMPSSKNKVDQTNSSIRSNDDSLSIINKIKQRKRQKQRQKNYEENWL